ncbi:small fragment nuclease isoform X2 [Eucyclogobius newberryi]|uniref:small fragment nuclease isoform X2 n=1 Tax=Eucyclogobius newberryi TaxID=166745 RepID=UPI003B5CFB8C
MPLMPCSRTPALAALTFLYRRRPRLTPRAAPSPSRCSSPRTNTPLPQPQFAGHVTSLPSPGSRFSFAEMSTDTSSRVSASSAAMSQRMVWVDLEMTGLDIEKDQIIEMACIITDSDLNVVAEGPNLIIKQPEELLDGMSDWCKEHHGQSGLTAAVRSSKISLEQAEYEFLSFVRQHTPPGQCPLAGNSVHADKRFLDKYMPQFMFHLHYRIIDVSTIKELSRRWFPEEYKEAPLKRASHRALEDIQESIKELHFYRARVFKSCAEKKRKITENSDGDKTSS